ncbi:MAG: DHH family phosphoesterase [Syntrophobacterales bacterium]|nr:MAG: DHH family phosphoesterase [Syntrophobacterales bacterium]
MRKLRETGTQMRRMSGFPDLESTRLKLHELRRLFSPEDRLLIVIKPDPDSIACSLAMKTLLLKSIKYATTAFVGEITRQENIALVKLLSIPMQRIEEIDFEEFNRMSILDGQPTHFDLPQDHHFDVIIDHHPITKGYSASFQDIRPSYGSTSTIMTEYLSAARIKPSTRLSTALLYGIKTDTNNFERHTRAEDVWAFRYLFPRANKNVLRKIELSELSPEILSYFKMAFDRMKIFKDKIFVHMGEIDHPDICVQLADFLMRVNNISWTVISSVVDDDLVIILRSDGYRKDAGKMASKLFGDLGHAGGHKSAARAEIPLENLRKRLRGLTEETIEKWITRRIKGYRTIQLPG